MDFNDIVELTDDELYKLYDEYIAGICYVEGQSYWFDCCYGRSCTASFTECAYGARRVGIRYGATRCTCGTHPNWRNAYDITYCFKENT